MTMSQQRVRSELQHPQASTNLPVEGILRPHEDVARSSMSVPEASRPIELHLDDIVWRDAVQDDRLVAIAREADANAVLDLDGACRKCAFERRGAARRIGLTLAVDTELLHGRASLTRKD